MESKIKRFADERDKQKDEDLEPNEQEIDEDLDSEESTDEDLEDMRDEGEDNSVDDEEIEDLEADDVEDQREDGQDQSIEDMVMGDSSPVPISQPINPQQNQAFETQLKQISTEARETLDSLESLKFFINEISKNMTSNPALAEEVEKKQAIVEEASKNIFDIVTEFETADVLKQYENPLSGIPNSQEDPESFAPEPENFTDDRTEGGDAGAGDGSSQNFDDIPVVDDPNDLLDMFGADGLVDMAGGEGEAAEPADEAGEEMDDFDEDIEPPSKSLPKQPKVEPKGKPKK